MKIEETEKIEEKKEVEGVEGGGNDSRSSKILKGLSLLGSSILSGMEYVGEIVADVLGLDDSKFQDIIDNMTEEDWKVAIEIDKERRLEDKIREVLEEESQKFASLHSQSLEDGETGHALYSETSLPPQNIQENSESDVTEFQILKTQEVVEQSFRPDGGFGYLSPEEVKVIKERVTAEFYLNEENNLNPHPNGPIPEEMIIRDNNTENDTQSENQSLTQSESDKNGVVELEDITTTTNSY